MFDKDLLYILTILEAIEKINLYTKDFDSVDAFFFDNDQLNFNATVNLLIAIGEESKKISSALKSKYLEVNWKVLAKLRDKIAHNYRGIAPNIIWNIVSVDMPKLKSSIIEIIKYGDIDKEIINEMIGTEYYKHVKYLLY